jgi:hypothetical protein
MNAGNRKVIKEIAGKGEFHGKLSELSANVGDRIRNAWECGKRGRVMATELECAALLHWQCMQFDGEWNEAEVVLTFEFMKNVIVC